MPGVIVEAGEPPQPSGETIDTWKWRDALAKFRWSMLWPVALVVTMVIYVVHFTGFTLDIHHGLGTSSFDIGLYDQGIWLMSRFKAPFVTLMGRNLMGDHTSFILVFLVPFYWLFPTMGTLLFAQSVALAAGAIPVYLYARRRLESAWMAFVCGCVYLVHPAVAWTNVENFHPDAFLGVLVGFAIYGALERRWVLYAVFVVLSLMVKEDVSFVVVPLGIWVAVRRDRRVGILTVIGSISFMAIAMLVIVRGLIGVATRNTWRIPFGGPWGLVRRVVSHPGDVYEHLRADSRPFYVWQMTSPFAFVFAKAPDVALISALVIGLNVLSTFGYQYSVRYHYSMVAVPALALGTVHALGAVSGRTRVKLIALVALTSFYGSYLWGIMPYSRNDVSRWGRDHPVAIDLREIIDEIPGDAAVSAYHSATPHLTHRVDIYQFPNPFRVVLYGTDDAIEGTRLEPQADEIEFVLLPTSLDDEGHERFDVIAPAFDLVASNDGWWLYQRDRTVPLPPLPALAGD